MRIDYVITGLDIGGAEFQAITLLEQLAQRGYQVRLISLITPSSTLLINRLISAGIPHLSLGMRSGRNLPSALFRLRREFLLSRPDVVHSHMVHANLLTRLVRLLIPSLKIICTAHNIYEGGKFRDWAYRLTNSLSQLNTTISAAATFRFISEKVFPKRNTRTIPNGIDINKFKLKTERKITAEKPFRWLAVGRLTEQKDYSTLIAALSKLQRSQLLIAGQGHLHDSLKNQVQQAGLQSRVDFLGIRNDIDQLYQQVDGFVLSSAFEGFGLVVAEAMACELPVVVTDSGGPIEIVGTTETHGLVVPIKNPGALAKAMTSIEAMSEQERKLLGQRARSRVQEKYSLDAIVTQWEHVYSELKNNN